MFLHMSVCPQGGLQAHTQGGRLRCLAWGGSPGPHPGGRFRGLAWGGSPGPHPGGCIPACTEADPLPSRRYCCGRYASYWNVFLFVIKFDEFIDNLLWKKTSNVTPRSATSTQSDLYFALKQVCRTVMNLRQHKC